MLTIRTRLASVALVTCLATAAGCAAGSQSAVPAAQPADRAPSDAPAEAADVAPAPKKADALPYRLWFRKQADKRAPPHVAAAPGGPAMAGEWIAGYFCGLDTSPSTLFNPEYSADLPGSAFHSHDVWRDVDGDRWLLFCRCSGERGDPGFTDEQRDLLGRWRHREADYETEIELLQGGVARSREGETWSWISDGDCLEIRRPLAPHTWRSFACTLAKDRRSYAEGSRSDRAVGERIGP